MNGNPDRRGPLARALAAATAMMLLTFALLIGGLVWTALLAWAFVTRLLPARLRAGRETRPEPGLVIEGSYVVLEPTGGRRGEGGTGRSWGAEPRQQ